MTLALWRISNHVDLDGVGGLYASGRWHPQGVRVVYLAEHPALALLEVLVHFDTDLDELPPQYTLMEVAAPADLVEELPVDAEQGRVRGLGAGWQDNLETTQRIGAEWLKSGRSALLRVPSAVAPFSHNYVLNLSLIHI